MNIQTLVSGSGFRKPYQFIYTDLCLPKPVVILDIFLNEVPHFHIGVAVCNG